MEIELRSFGNSISFVRLGNSVCQVLKNTPTQIRILSKIRKIRTEANLRKLSGFQLNHASLHWKKNLTVNYFKPKTYLKLEKWFGQK